MKERTGIPKSRLVEILADEGERSRRYPGLAFRGPDSRRRAWIMGSPFDVWEVVQAWRDLDHSEQAVQDQLAISDRQLRLALAYYREFENEIESALALAGRSLTELESAYPFAEMVTIKA